MERKKIHFDVHCDGCIKTIDLKKKQLLEKINYLKKCGRLSLRSGGCYGKSRIDLEGPYAIFLSPKQREYPVGVTVTSVEDRLDWVVQCHGFCDHSGEL